MDFLRNTGFTMPTPPAPRIEDRSAAWREAFKINKFAYRNFRRCRAPGIYLVALQDSLLVPIQQPRLLCSTHFGVTCHTHSRRASARAALGLPSRPEGRSPLTDQQPPALIPHTSWLALAGGGTWAARSAVARDRHEPEAAAKKKAPDRLAADPLRIPVQNCS